MLSTHRSPHHAVWDTYLNLSTLLQGDLGKVTWHLWIRRCIISDSTGPGASFADSLKKATLCTLIVQNMIGWSHEEFYLSYNRSYRPLLLRMQLYLIYRPWRSRAVVVASPCCFHGDYCFSLFSSWSSFLLMKVLSAFSKVGLGWHVGIRVRETYLCGMFRDNAWLWNSLFFIFLSPAN